jgi:hypothetical protein
LVQLGYAAALSLRFVAMAGAIVVALASAEVRPQREAAFGMTLETILDRHAAMQPFLLDVADEVRRMVSRAYPSIPAHGVRRPRNGSLGEEFAAPGFPEVQTL